MSAKFLFKSLCFSIACVFSSVAVAGLEEGIAAYNKSDYDGALREFLPLAKQNNMTAKYFIARMMLESKPSDENFKLAWQTIYDAADSGVRAAQFYIAYDILFYQKNDARAKYFDRAITYLQKSADLNYPPAQYLWSTLLRKGDGVAKNQKLANDYLIAAAKQSDPDALYYLGDYLIKGSEGWKKDEALGAKSIVAAADLGHSVALVHAGSIYFQGIGGFSIDEKKGLSYIYQGVDRKNPGAMLILAGLYGQQMPSKTLAANPVFAYAWAKLSNYYGSSQSDFANKIINESLKQLDREGLRQANELVQKIQQKLDTVEKAPASPANNNATNSRNSSGSVQLAGFGSGFAISPNGHIVTNYHVIDGCKALNIPALDLRAEVISADRSVDLALLKVKQNFKNYPAIRGLQNQIELGEEIVVLGYPLPSKLSSGIKVTNGTLSAYGGIGNNSTLFQISAPVQGGNSGGPVFDRFGNVVATPTSAN